MQKIQNIVSDKNDCLDIDFVIIVLSNFSYAIN